jgi:hypothetical protein
MFMFGDWSVVDVHGCLHAYSVGVDVFSLGGR